MLVDMHLASCGTRATLVPIICDTLGVLAFDGQANLLIWPAGYASGG